MTALVVSGADLTQLRELLQGLLDSGVQPKELLADMSAIRDSLTDDEEEVVLDAMDLLVGWCAPSARLRRQDGDDQ